MENAPCPEPFAKRGLHPVLGVSHKKHNLISTNKKVIAKKISVKEKSFFGSWFGNFI
jgi:hypothetical protein